MPLSSPLEGAKLEDADGAEARPRHPAEPPDADAREEWGGPPGSSETATAGSAVRFAREAIGHYAGGLIVEIADPDATPAEREQLLTAIADGHGPELARHGAAEPVEMRTLAASAARESVEGALGRWLARQVGSRAVTAVSATPRARRQAVSQTVGRIEEDWRVLIAATDAEHWTRDAGQMQWLRHVVERNPRLRAVLVLGEECGERPRHESMRRLRVVRGLRRWREVAGEDDTVGATLLRMVSHDIAAEGGTGWKLTAAERWQESYVFRTDGTDPYQRALSARGACALGHHLARRILGPDGLAKLVAQTTCADPIRLGRQVAWARLERGDARIEIEIGLRRAGATACRGRRGGVLAWPEGGALGHDAYGSAALACVGWVLGDRSARETADRFEASTGERWDGQDVTFDTIESMLDAGEMAVEPADSRGETEVHCEGGGTAILALESRSHETHAVIRDGIEIHDPGGFRGLGRLWVDGDPDVRLHGALLVDDERAPLEVVEHAVHFTRRDRPPYARKRRKPWKSR